MLKAFVTDVKGIIWYPAILGNFHEGLSIPILLITESVSLAEQNMLSKSNNHNMMALYFCLTVTLSTSICIVLLWPHLATYD